MFDFVSRRLGPDIAEFAIDPLVRGVCAGDSKEISVKFLLKAFKEAEQKYGRVFFGLLANALSKSPPPTYPVSELAKKAQSERYGVYKEDCSLFRKLWLKKLPALASNYLLNLQHVLYLMHIIF